MLAKGPYVLQLERGSFIMRTMSADIEKIGLRELIDAVRDEPVTVLANGEPAVVVLSPAEFDRLEEHDRIRREANARLRQTISAIQREAAERGLTEAELERLLADES
jgi:prevent-host-death family protein